MTTVADMLGATALAIDPVAGQALLAQVWPQQAPAAAAPLLALGRDLVMQRGQRFAVQTGVAVVPVRGMLTPDSVDLEEWLGWTTYVGLEATCAELAAADDVQAAVLDVSCAGGMVLGMTAAADAIAALARVKPVYALANPMASSAAYGLASQATTISVTPGGTVGSIGILSQRRAPVAPALYDGSQGYINVSSHARAKWPDPTTEAGQAEIRRALDVAETELHALVARGRRIAPADLPARLSVTGDTADGGADYTPADAVARGLADAVETRLAFYDRVFRAHQPAPSRTPARGARARAAAALALSSI